MLTNNRSTGFAGRRKPFLSNAMFCAALLASAGYGQSESTTPDFVQFKDFLDRTQTVNSRDLVHPESRVKEAVSFEEMRHHVLTMYEGVDVTHSFVMGSSHFDCIPVMQQPAVRMLGIKTIAAEPPQTSIAPVAGNHEAAEGPTLPASLNRKNASDQFGNSLTCEAGTIPMRRITLEEMTRFPTLRQFFEKGPNGAGRALQSKSADAPGADLSDHRYSVMNQDVDNLGGNSNLNIWSPYVDTNKGEVFSLAQEWYVGGSGDNLQTAEVGLQNYPGHYGDQNSRLFIFWTADNYTTGCYNLDCGAFVQKDNSIPIGGSLSNGNSTYGGPQYELRAEFQLYQGNWWLRIQDTWVGYYPGSIYAGGQLIRHAEHIQFGTESVGTAGSWPPEGSGEWSTAGWSKASYQRNLYYRATTGDLYWDTLTPFIQSPTCYTVSGPFSNPASGWTTFFYQGGPGGSGC